MRVVWAVGLVVLSFAVPAISWCQATSSVWYLLDAPEGDSIVANGPITLRFGQVASTCAVSMPSGSCMGGPGTPTPEAWTSPQTFTPAAGATTVTIVVGAAAFGGVDPLPGVVKTVEVEEESTAQNITVNGQPVTVPGLTTSLVWYLLNAPEGDTIVANGPITLRFGQVASKCVASMPSGPCTGGPGTPTPEAWTSPQTFTPAAGATTVTIVVGAAAFGGVDPLPGVVKTVEAEEESTAQNITVNGQPVTVPGLTTSLVWYLLNAPEGDTIVAPAPITLRFGQMASTCAVTMSSGPCTGGPGTSTPEAWTSPQTFTPAPGATTVAIVVGAAAFGGVDPLPGVLKTVEAEEESTAQNITVNGQPVTVPALSSTCQLTANPSSISFPNTTLGYSYSSQGSIVNNCTTAITVASVQVAAPFSASGFVTPFSVASGQTHNYTAVFTPTAAGAVTGTITFLGSSSSGQALSITLSGTGVASSQGLLSSSPTTLSFGNVTINSSQSLSATITNTGSASVTVSAVKVSGTGFSLGSPTTAFTLAAQQSTQIPVTFSPTSAGSATGTLSITSDAQNPSLTVPLSGTGTHYVTLSWQDTGSQIAGYNAYRSTVSGGSYSKIDSSLITSTNYNDATVAAGQTYYYVVTAVSTAGVESDYSSEVTVVVPSP